MLPTNLLKSHSPVFFIFVSIKLVFLGYMKSPVNAIKIHWHEEKKCVNNNLKKIITSSIRLVESKLGSTSSNIIRNSDSHIDRTIKELFYIITKNLFLSIINIKHSEQL